MSVFVSLAIAAGLAAIPTISLRFLAQGFWAEQSVSIGFVLWFFLLIFIITPIRIGMEKVGLTTGTLVVEGAEIYDDGMGCHWLRLRVKNPSALPIKDCYGKLIDRRLITTPINDGLGRPLRLLISPEAGRISSENAVLPPEGHKFPWAPTTLPDITITIAGFGSKEFLYVVAKRKNTGSFGFPTDMGIKYDNYALGEFQLVIEIGSEFEAFQPTKARVVFRAGGAIEFVTMDTPN